MAKSQNQHTSHIITTNHAITNVSLSQ